MIPNSSLILFNNSIIFCSLSASKLPVGSSAINISGLLIRALAKATLCFSPPLILSILLLNISFERPRVLQISLMLFSPFSKKYLGSRIFSFTVKPEIKLKFWNTQPIFLRLTLLKFFISKTELPQTKISPSFKLVIPNINLTRVVFPNPERPTIAVVLPFLNSKLQFLKIYLTFDPSLKHLVTFTNLIMISPSFHNNLANQLYYSFLLKKSLKVSSIPFRKLF
ncbi:hypothetical protein Spaf_0664 [Streptococcus parasanguinis FW213]|uniref:Uncharacterized protein n=1 Tax=Streptococcus parasanguinis FW213 TaxID=1114965 RepID=I1ZKU7_STRPA|nr:hypothetical protein Spaf_0664 [Streptococcus parasanguinis FW213]